MTHRMCRPVKIPKTYFYSVGNSNTAPARTATVKIKRSVFICSLSYADTIDRAKAFISRVAKENKTATHNCWAYIVGEKGETCHCSDAGEPPGTAGKPMLNTLKRHDMTRVAAVVTRHFGGVKLGVRGLAQAYAESVSAAVLAAPLVKLVKRISVRVTLDYAFNDTFIKQMGDFSPVILDTAWTDRVTHVLEVEAGCKAAVARLLGEYEKQGLLDYDVLKTD